MSTPTPRTKLHAWLSQLTAATEIPEEIRQLPGKMEGLNANLKALEERIFSADIRRIVGIDEAYAVVLKKVDILDIHHLSRAEATKLHEKIKEQNPRRVPGEKEIEDWILQAKFLQTLIAKH